jgi:hypothetical protein
MNTNKFFFFKRSEPGSQDSFFSDSGKSVSAIVLPVDLFSYMTSKQGSVRMFFNQATPFEENNLLEGQSFEKTNVEVFCEVGQEAQLMENIMNFISRKDTNKVVMRFDSANGSNTFSEVSFDNISNVILPSVPVDRGTFTPKNKESGTSIVGVDFRDADNLPIVDYNEEASGLGNSGTDVSTWQNDANVNFHTPSALDLDGATGYRPEVAASSDGDDIVSKAYVDFYSTDISPQDQKVLICGESIDLKRDFVCYSVVVINKQTPPQSFFGSQTTLVTTPTTVGPFPENAVDEFKIDFTANTADARKIKSLSKFPVRENGDDDSESSLYVFVIRRDSDKNLYFYDRNGDIIAEKASSDETDGVFQFKALGGILGPTKIKIARFGLITKDVGDELCRSIAQQLYKHYRV